MIKFFFSSCLSLLFPACGQSVKTLAASSLAQKPVFASLLYDLSHRLPLGAEIQGQFLGFARGGASVSMAVRVVPCRM